ncbi:hypothetical protein GCM10027258_93290 [Amycolatopsis stemonae]
MSEEMDHDAIARRWDKAPLGASDGERMNRDEVAARWDLYARGALTPAPLPDDDGEERRRARRRRRSAELNTIIDAGRLF